MKCPSCGMENPAAMRFCGNCAGALMPQDMKPEQGRSRQCVECGRSIGWDAIACMYCGRDYRKRQRPGTEGYLTTGAILTIVAGVLGAAILSVMIDQWHHLSAPDTLLAVISYSCSVLGVVGGIAALTRVQFPIAVLGATCAIFTPAFFFAIPGLGLIATSAANFKGYGGNEWRQVG